MKSSPKEQTKNSRKYSSFLPKIVGREFTFRDNKYRFSPERRHVLKGIALTSVGSGSVLGYHLHNTQPAVAIDASNWNARDLGYPESDDDIGEGNYEYSSELIEQIIIGNNEDEFKLIWQGLDSERVYDLSIRIEARIKDDDYSEDVTDDAKDYRTVASTVDSDYHKANIEGNEGEKELSFFYAGGKDEPGEHDDIVVKEGELKYGVDIIEQHEAFDQDIFNPDPDEIEPGESEVVERNVQIKVTVQVRRIDDVIVSKAVAEDDFGIYSEYAVEEGQSEVEGSANSELVQEEVVEESEEEESEEEESEEEESEEEESEEEESEEEESEEEESEEEESEEEESEEEESEEPE